MVTRGSGHAAPVLPTARGPCPHASRVLSGAAVGVLGVRTAVGSSRETPPGRRPKHTAEPGDRCRAGTPARRHRANGENADNTGGAGESRLTESSWNDEN